MNTWVWLQPSLLRRIVLTLMLALLLVWLALSLKDYWAFKQDIHQRESLGRITQAILDSLQGFDEGQARTAMTVADRVYNDLRRKTDPQATGALLFRLSRSHERVVYTSSGSLGLTDLPSSGSRERIQHQGVDYWPVVQSNAQWRLVMWVPVLEDGAALLRIGRDVLGYVLLAFPLVMLPLVLALWLALRPLHSLSTRVSQRTPDDLSPLNEPTGYLELKPLVHAFNALLTRAAHQRHAEKTFVQDAAHELKTPLAVVAAQAHVLASAQDKAQRSDALLALEHGVQRASHQVNQLLSLASLDHAQYSAVHSVDLVEVAREVLIELEPLACAKATSLALDSPDKITLTLDEVALRLVLVNLIQNAIQHGAPGGAVEIQLEQHTGTVSLQVSDNGPGIAAHEQNRVFDRFYRAQAVRTSGSGLGLAIVKRAVERMGATVSIQNSEAPGTSVVVQWTSC